MKCPHCNFENKPDARFCRSCGQALQATPQPEPAPADPGPQAQIPAPVSGVICASCGATAKVGARFCPRCGHELHPAPPAALPTQAPARAPVQLQPYAQQPPAPQQPVGVPQVTQPMPSAAQAQPAGAYPPQQPPPSAPPAYMESPSAPPATPAAPGQPAQVKSRFPWWGWVLIAVGLVGILVIGFLVVSKALAPLAAPTTTPTPTEASTAIAIAAPTEIPTSTAEPTATLTPSPTDTPEPPTPTLSDISINLSLVPEDFKVGDENITLVAIITNHGTVPVNILRYEVLGLWEPFLKLKTDPFIEEDPGVRPLDPQASMELLFQFDAEQAGTVKLKVDVKMQVLAEQPFTDGVHSDTLEVTISE